MSLSIYSQPQFGACASRPHGYASCEFTYYCQTEGWGVLEYDLDCADFPRAVCTGVEYVPTSDCRLESYGTIVVAAGDCRDVTMTVTARSFADAMPLSHQVRLCVDADGPYLEQLVNYQPQPRLDLP